MEMIGLGIHLIGISLPHLSAKTEALAIGTNQMNTQIAIRKAEDKDLDAIWDLIKGVIAGGDTYVFPPDSSREEMLGYWCGADKHTYVALLERRIVGTFIIKDNFPGLDSHIANASYMTAPAEFGKGIGRTMGEYSIAEARRLVYQAMQFNIVVKRNERAVQLWKKLGFRIIGEIPDAFNHLKLREVLISIVPP